jgi:hypothetical protein
MSECKTCGGPNEDPKREQCIECDNDLEHVNAKIARNKEAEENVKVVEEWAGWAPSK